MRARFFFSALAGALFAPDALAWGLQTHVFLAQWALAAVPLADPQVRAAALRLPALCRRAMGFISGETNFSGYVGDAKSFVMQIDAVLRGAEPRLQPEPDQAIKKEAPAMNPPSAPPAITSLG